MLSSSAEPDTETVIVRVPSPLPDAESTELLGNPLKPLDEKAANRLG